MSIGVRMAMLVLAGLLFAAPAQAAQLWPLQTGQWMEQDKQDNLGHNWTVRVMVFEETTMDNGKPYFRIQKLYYDPYDFGGGDTFEEFYMRSTDTELWFYSGPGQPERLAFRTGPVGDYWEYQEEDETGHPYTVRREIVATNDQITIPYGGAHTAYKYKVYAVNDPTSYDMEWMVPGLGYAQEDDHWFHLPEQAGRTSLSVLARVGANPLFLPLKTGMRLTYNASDQKGHTWQMHLEVKEQVTLNDGLTYFHMRQVNYDPIGGNVNNEFYARCNLSQMYARKLDENPAHLEYQAAGPGTAWNFPREFNGTPAQSISKLSALGRLMSWERLFWLI